MKMIVHPDTGLTYRMGRQRAVARSPRLSLGNYLMKALPAPPATCDYTPKAKAALEQVYLNDQLGDCVIAYMGHSEGVFAGNADAEPYVLTDGEIIALYSAIGGYVLGDPATDNGCNEQTALHYWQQHGAPKGENRIAGSLAVNAADPVECRTALWLFENLCFGVELPDEWINPPPGESNFIWGVAGPPDPENGHCFLGMGYHDNSTIDIATWGMTGMITLEAVKEYAGRADGGELWTVISQQAINKATKKAPAGFDWTQLVADFDAIGGKITLPA